MSRPFAALWKRLTRSSLANSGVMTGGGLVAFSLSAATLPGLLIPLPAKAVSTISQTYNLNFTGGSTAFSFNRFDTLSGARSLSAVRFSYSSSTGQSFSISGLGTLTDITYGSSLSWTTVAGLTRPTTTSSAVESIAANISPSLSLSLDNETQTFAISPQVSRSGSRNDLTAANLLYFTGSGSATGTYTNVIASNSISNASIDRSSLQTTGSITLEYDYIDVPAPLPAIGAIAAYSFLNRQRRRLKAAK